MLYTEFECHQLERFLKVLPYLGMTAFLVVSRQQLTNTFFPTLEAPSANLLVSPMALLKYELPQMIVKDTDSVSQYIS